MKKYIDLHLHTKYSDGEKTPEEVIAMASEVGLDIISITDHDTYVSYEEAQEEARKYGIQLIPGVEISTKGYHLSALGFNPNNSELKKLLEKMTTDQEVGTMKKVTILQNQGVPISREKVKKEFPRSRLGKGNIMHILHSDLECQEYLSKLHPGASRADIYNYYLGKNGIAKKTWEEYCVSAEDAIGITHEAGGIVGINHAPKNMKEISELEDLIQLGIDFIEIQPKLRSGPFRRNVTYEELEKIAKEKNIPLSYGSDYHGPNFPRPFLDRGENILGPELKALLETTHYANNS